MSYEFKNGDRVTIEKLNLSDYRVEPTTLDGLCDKRDILIFELAEKINEITVRFEGIK